MRNILLLAGDGIGPEIMDEAKKILNCFKDFISYDEGYIRGIAIDKLAILSRKKRDKKHLKQTPCY